MTNITLKTYIEEINQYNFNVFLEETFFYMMIQTTDYILTYIINHDYFKKEWIDKKKDQCIQDDTIKVFTSILKYLETIKSFIIDTSLIEKSNPMLLPLKTTEKFMTFINSLEKNNNVKPKLLELVIKTLTDFLDLLEREEKEHSLTEKDYNYTLLLSTINNINEILEKPN